MAEQMVNSAPVDGEIIINVLPNYSAAFLTIYPAQNGGKDVTYDSVMNALTLKGVRHNIDEDLIRSAIENRSFDCEMRIANADMPENGVDGVITYKFDKNKTLAPKQTENGFVDYKDLGLIRNIHENDIIATITLPTPGKNGMDVRGVEMKAIPGKPAAYTVGRGTKLADDGLSIVAVQDGHVCYRDKAFCVDEMVTIGGDVDASVGNIDFLGDVVIKGEVFEGFVVSAGKNVTINGNVTGATVLAGGSITVKKGSINSKLKAHNDITCDFCEYSDLSTDGNVNVHSLVVCDVYCGGNMTAKSISGGKYTVLGNTETTYLGTKTYAPTEVTAGDNAMLTKEKNECLKKIEEKEATILRCTQIVDFLTAKRKELKRLPDDKEELLGSTLKSKISYQNDIKQIKKRIAKIDESLAQRQTCYVSVKGIAYPGARVVINEEVKKFEVETPRIKIYLDSDGMMDTGPA